LRITPSIANVVQLSSSSIPLPWPRIPHRPAVAAGAVTGHFSAPVEDARASGIAALLLVPEPELHAASHIASTPTNASTAATEAVGVNRFLRLLVPSRNVIVSPWFSRDRTHLISGGSPTTPAHSRQRCVDTVARPPAAA
jgi:hypothetical protein